MSSRGASAASSRVSVASAVFAALLAMPPSLTRFRIGPAATGREKFSSPRVRRRPAVRVQRARRSHRVVIDPALLQRLLSGSQEAFPARRRDIVDQVIAGFGQSRSFTSHQHSDHVRPFAARIARGRSAGSESPSRPKAKEAHPRSPQTRSAEGVAEAPKRQAPAAEPRSLKFRGEACQAPLRGCRARRIPRQPRRSATGDWSRMRNRISRCTRSAARGGGAGPSRTKPGARHARFARGAGRGRAPGLEKPVAHKAPILVAHGRVGDQRHVFASAAGRDRRGAPGCRSGRRRARFPTASRDSGRAAATTCVEGLRARRGGSASPGPRPTAASANRRLWPGRSNGRARRKARARRAGRRRRRRSTAPARARAATAPAAGTRSARCRAAPPPTKTRRDAARSRPYSLR